MSNLIILVITTLTLSISKIFGKTFSITVAKRRNLDLKSESNVQSS